MSEKEYTSFIEFTTGLEEQPLPELLTQETQWEMYVTVIDEARALVLVDLEMAKMAPVFKYNTLFGIQVAINHPTEDGFYSTQEQPQLFAIEDRIEEVFMAEAHAKFVATVTTAGTRNMYFYASDDTYLAGLVGKISSQFPQYQFNYLLEKDGHWNFYYEVLYPSVMDLQLIKNRQMIVHMQEMGVDLNQEKEVNHWFFFSNGAGRRQAATQLVFKGYEILDDNFYDEKMPNFPFGLKVLMKHDLQLETMIEKTYEAYEFIEDYDGAYDGWDVVPDGDPEAAFI